MPTAPKRNRGGGAAPAAPPAARRRTTGDKNDKGKAVDKQTADDHDDDGSVYGLPRDQIEELQAIPDKLKTIEESLAALATLPDTLRTLERNVAGTITKIDQRIGDVEVGLDDVRNDMEAEDEKERDGEGDSTGGGNDGTGGGDETSGSPGADPKVLAALADARRRLEAYESRNINPFANSPAGAAGAASALISARDVARDPARWFSFVGTDQTTAAIKIDNLIREIEAAYRVTDQFRNTNTRQASEDALDVIRTLLAEAAVRSPAAAPPSPAGLLAAARTLMIGYLRITYGEDTATAWGEATRVRAGDNPGFASAFDALPPNLKIPAASRPKQTGGGRDRPKGQNPKGKKGYWQGIKAAIKQKKQQAAASRQGGGGGGAASPGAGAAAATGK